MQESSYLPLGWRSSSQPALIASLLHTSSSDWLDNIEITVKSGLSAIPVGPVDVARAAFHLNHHIKEFQHAIAAPERCPFPVIVATHGLAFGLAIDMITACDVRYAASNASFSIRVWPRS